ncbi:MAG: LmbE family protein [Bacillales bacterium]|jgi:bacillithiol biosynthesis deacetylase BshB2|nr:LmbE family protein [Bacillales bacterium]
MEKERAVLIVFPHPDDEAFGTSGSIIDFVSQGVPVTYLCLTLGEMGRNLGSPFFATRESLPAFRKNELNAAGEVLGCNMISMGLRDKTIEFLDYNTISAQILKIIKDVNPSLIISHYPPYAVHPDHNASGEIIIKTLNEMPAEERPKLWLTAFSKGCEDEIGQPDIVRDIQKHAMQKLAAIRAHRSQTEAMTKDWDKLIEKNDPSMKNRFMMERFWTYKFD